MKEIKFRAWHKKEKVMTQVESLIITPNNGIWINDYPDTGNLEMMQYTGLKDKNGKECYFGDWVKTNDKVFEVTWNDAGFIELKEALGRNLFQWAPGTWITKREVIGNIYENPELLK